MKVVEFFKDLGLLFYGLACAARAKMRQRKLPPYFAKNLPERYVNSPIYGVRFDWYRGLCYAVIDIDLRVDGFDPTGIDINHTDQLRQEARRIAEEYLSDPPIPVNIAFSIKFRDDFAKFIIEAGTFPN